jgi:hypothetical protein
MEPKMSRGPERWMTDAACRWAEAEGLQCLLEYRTPWGVCDIAGVEIDRGKLNMRARSGQLRELGPLRRVAVFEAFSSGDSLGMSVSDVAALTGNPLASVERDLKFLQAGKFITECKPGKFVRRTPWAPLHKRIVAIELKAQSLSNVVAQAKANMSFATESYVGLPLATAAKLYGSDRRSPLVEAGLGLLGTRHHGAEVLLKPSPSARFHFDRVVQTHCTEQSALRLVEIYRQTSISA